MTRCARPSGSLLAGSSSVQLAAPLLSPSLGLAPSGPEQALFKNAPGVFVSNPGRWFSSPLGLGDTYKQKARTSVQALNLNMAVRGGLTRCARPSGSLLASSSSVQLAAPLLSPSLGLAPSGPEQALFKNAPGVFVSNPGRWFSSPLGLGDTYKQKARTSVQALNLNMAVRGGFEPPIRCRIHTFQACSFSHSDTSPNCRSSITGTGANVGKYPFYVNQLF